MQTDFNLGHGLAVKGMFCDTSPVRDVQTAIVDATNGRVQPGDFVVVKTPAPPGGRPIVELPNATGEITGDLGFGFVHNNPVAPNADLGYGTGDVVAVLTRGRIWVECEQANNAHGTPVFIRFSAAGAERLGSVRIDADTADAVALPGAHLLTTCGAAGLAECEYFKQD